MSRTTRRLLTAWLILGTILWLVCWHRAAEGQAICPPASGRGCGVGVNVGRLSVDLRAGLTPAVLNSCVVPVFVGSDPSPAAGVYVGTICGQGVVLTCLHAARYGVRAVGSEVPADIYRDMHGYDMAALIVPPLHSPAAAVGEAPRPGETVEIIGYPLGRFGRHRGRVLGYFRPEGDQPWGDLSVDTASQDGDSGGAVLGANGRLVGLLWGSRTDGSAGSVAVSAPAIADFLRRLEITLRESSTMGAEGSAPDREPITRGTEVPGPGPLALDRADDRERIAEQYAELRDRLAGVADGALSPDAVRQIAREAAAGEIPSPDSVRAIAREAVASQSPSLLTLAVPAILAGLGWTGPPAVAAVVGLRLAAAIVRRRRSKRKQPKGGADEPAQGFSGCGSLLRNDEEARQFLQLSRLEGRSPLHDALIGRIAFDELEKAIDAKPDGPDADFARALRRTLEDRFNQMAPVAA